VTRRTRRRVAGERRQTSAHAGGSSGSAHAGGSSGNAHAGGGSSDSSSHSPWQTRAAVIAAITALIATIGALYYNGQASRQATEQARQAQIAQTSDRFSRSVEQLGSDSIAVRIGAAYSFGRLMRDSNDDQQAISEILSSFIRLQAAQAAPVRKGQKTRPAPADVLAALNVLDDQPRPRTHTSPDGTVVTWASMHLNGVTLTGFDLQHATMREADLSHADLRGAGLTFAHLRGADLIEADLRGAHLKGAGLTFAHLRGADLRGADLTDADLRGADLIEADLRGADLGGAHMRRADLTDADLTDADLTGVYNLDSVVCSASTQWPEDLTPLPPCATH
jgi:hypothetical protein